MSTQYSLPLLGSLVIGFAVFHAPLTWSASQTKAGFNQQSGVVVHGTVSGATAVPQWSTILLPAGYEPLVASDSGVAVLRDSTYYYRWRGGVLDRLEPYVQSVVVVPETATTPGSVHHRRTSVLINNVGDVAILWKESKGISFRQHYSGSYTTSDFHDRINTYPNGAKTFRTHRPKGFSFHWNEGQADVSGYWEKIDLPLLDDFGNLYYVTVTPTGFSGPYPFKDIWLRVDPTGGETELDRRFIGASRSGVALYDTSTETRSSTTYSGLIDTVPVNFSPIGVNDNDVVFGYTSTSTSNTYVLRFPDGHTELLPTDVIPLRIDDRNNPVGEVNGRSVAWIKRRDSSGDPEVPVQYDQADFVLLTGVAPFLEGWTTDHRISPGSRAVQLGLATGGAGTRAFLALPSGPVVAVDANRDGRVTTAMEDGSDATSDANPFRFWLNDDVDRGHTVDGTDYEQDDISPTEAATNNWVADWKSNKVGFTRDLEDFARIVVSTNGLSDAFRNGDLYLGLKWTDTVGTPSIKLYKQYDATGSASYLTDDYQASVQLAEVAILNQRYASDDPAWPSAHTVVRPGDLFVLPQGLWLGGLTGDALKRSLLFEGCTAGKGQLKLVIFKRDGTNYTEIGEGPGVWLDLKNIREMYEHWTVGQGPVPSGGGAPSPLGQASSFTYTAQSPDEAKYILFVHGWNLEQWEKERFAETAYKRLYWQGYKGRFGLFSWPTTNGFDSRSAIADSTNYDRGERSAWRSASLLEQKLAELNGQYQNQVYLVAHSMGNVVAGEALRRAGQDGLGVIVRTYVASQAAVPVQCYNGSFPDNLDADVPFSGIVRAFDGGWPQTANAYKSWLVGSSAAVAKRVNFFNINDWALWRDIWQLNQWLKPDHPDFRPNPPDPQRKYVYLDDINQPPTQDGFGWIRLDGSSDPSDRPYLNNTRVAVLRLGSAADVKDRYEIMAMASESRSKALGATPFNEGLDASVWLGSIWPADPSGDARPYSRHKWHSAQFRSTNTLQKGYWQTLLGPQGFNISTQP